ncbi:uncharacterized protein LOC103700955 [Phoenix dactylifera]|uniref:Uncharacterized protein LOC103700955 n=1 Tax=Phoenix dactylifera TaxID=42345 RepID=A0A8B7BLK0_PHODC|nr:uncharacterized protein LOC103700955 [Phoenix dactylifera]
MGNHGSCIRRSTRPRTAKVVDAEGNLRRVEIPAGVADLMLEAPGHVVAHAEEVVRTRRVSGLRAEEELRPEEVYLLLPVDRIGSRISDQQIAIAIGAVEGGRRWRRKGKKGKQGCGYGSRVFPAVAGEDAERGGEENGLSKEGKVAGFPGQRIGGHRQWRPVLDTIHESN